MFKYIAYGLLIQSDISLPFLSAGDYDEYNHVSGNITIRLHADSALYVHPPHEMRSQWRITREKAELVIRDIAAFHIQQGRQIDVHAAPSFDEKMIQLLLINSVLAILLFQRKMLVLHTSVIRIGDMAVAFMGTSGAGKSLMAGTLCARGNSLITDDIAPVELSASSPFVHSGYPMVKMKPADSAMLGFVESRNRFLHKQQDKYGLDVRDKFTGRPCPLKYIFLLETGKDRDIEELSRKESFIHLIGNSAPTIWQVPADELHFTQLEKLLEKVKVCRFVREEDVEALPEHAEMVEDYCNLN